MRIRYALLLGVALGTAVTLQSHQAMAQANPLDQMLASFHSRSAGWEGALTTFALGTFGILAGIEIAWAAFRLAFRGSDASEWMAEIVNQILYLGFFLALLENSVTWGTAIVNSFRQAAGTAGGNSTMAPSDIFSLGVKMALVVYQQMSVLSPAASAGLAIAAIVIEVCFALIAAFMVLALVESYLIISMGVIFMAFGGSRWTKDLAVSTVRYSVSVGAKLFVMQLLVSVGAGLIQDWANSFTDVTDASICILIGCSIVLLALVKVLPETMQRLVNGASMASGSALVAAAAAVGGGVAGMAAGMAGVPGMAANATKLASAQLSASDAKAAESSGGQAPERSAMGRAATVAGMAARNMAAAPLRDLGRRLQGDIGARHGVATWRMSADLATKRRLLTDDQNKPQAAAPSGNSIS